LREGGGGRTSPSGGEARLEEGRAGRKKNKNRGSFVSGGKGGGEFQGKGFKSQLYSGAEERRRQRNL